MSLRKKRPVNHWIPRALAIMDRKGITRKDLADRLGSSKGWVTQLLSDREQRATIATVEKIADALGVTAEELMK